MSNSIVLLLALAASQFRCQSSLVPHCSPHPAVLGLKPTAAYALYSGRASRETLLKVADATPYKPEVGKAVAALTSA